MTVGAWLREHDSAPPRLSARILEVVNESLDEPIERTDEVLLDCAARLLDDVVARPTAGREAALDLLVVDALTTYALEAASAHPMRLPERASEAMRRFQEVAGP